MWSAISKLIGSIICCFTSMYIAGNILNKLDYLFKKKNGIIYALIVGVIASYVYNFTDGIVRVGLNMIVITYGIKIIFNSESVKASIISIILMLFIITSETLLAIFITFVLKQDLNLLNETVFGKTLFNVLVACGMTIFYFSCQKKVKQIVNNYKFGNTLDIVLVSLGLFIAVTYMFKNIRANVSSAALIFNIASVLTMLVLLVGFFIEKINNKIAKDERMILNKNITIYENTVEKLRISQHENINELSIIKNMVSPQNTKLKAYLNEIIADKKTDVDVELMLKLRELDSVIIKSLLYEKTSIIYNDKIKLTIDTKTTKTSLINRLPIIIEKDLCKILGVLIDNAIDCVKKNEDYMMGIIISSDDNKLDLDIFNNYDSLKFLESKKTYDSGLFLNLRKHGNGLQLLNRIIQKHDNLFFKTEVDPEFISQKIEYKENNKFY